MLKPLPHNLEAEKSLLGCLLIDNTLIEQFFDEFDMEIFYEAKHIKIIKAMFELYNDGLTIDLITVNGKGIELDYIMDLTSILPTSSNWYSYAKMVENEYKRREIILKARKIEQEAYNEEGNIEQLIEQSFTDINNIMSSGKSKAITTDMVIDKLKAHLEESRGKGLLGWSWSIDWLDEYTGGIRGGKTYRIAGGSGLGKTNLYYTIIPRLLEQGAKVMFVSLENSIEDTYIKLMSNVVGANPIALQKGNAEMDYGWLDDAKDSLYITDQLFDLNEIKREILKVKPDIVLLDYIQQVEVKGTRNELEKLDTYAREVKKFMQQNQNIAWIDISQLNMNADDSDLKKTGKFKGSGELKNAVDFGLHLFYYDPFFKYKEIAKGTPAEKEIENRTAIEFYVTKNRLGPTFGNKVFGINFNEGINYKEIPQDVLSSWF